MPYVALLALTGYAIYRQSQRHEVAARAGSRWPIIYAVAGLVVGGFSQPNRAAEWGLLIISIALSVGVGLARGRLTRMWTEDRPDGRHVIAKAPSLTIGLFVAMVVVKFGLGTWAYFNHVSDDGGFGEILIMIAVMIAFQAELVWRRAQAMRRPRPDRREALRGRHGLLRRAVDSLVIGFAAHVPARPLAACAAPRAAPSSSPRCGCWSGWARSTCGAASGTSDPTSDQVAASIGYTQSMFQWEIGWADIALGVLGVLCARARTAASGPTPRLTALTVRSSGRHRPHHRSGSGTATSHPTTSGRSRPASSCRR